MLEGSAVVKVFSKLTLVVRTDPLNRYRWKVKRVASLVSANGALMTAVSPLEYTPLPVTTARPVGEVAVETSWTGFRSKKTAVKARLVSTEFVRNREVLTTTSLESHCWNP